MKEDIRILGLFIKGFLQDYKLSNASFRDDSDNSTVRYVLSAGNKDQCEIYIDKDGDLKSKGTPSDALLASAIRDFDSKNINVIYGSNKKVKPEYQEFYNAMNSTFKKRLEKANKLLNSEAGKIATEQASAIMGPIGALGVEVAKSLISKGASGKGIKGTKDSMTKIVYKRKVKDNSLSDELDKVIDTEKLIKLLQRALAEELQAWYQYWIAAPFMVGEERKNIEELFNDTADDELNDHAVKIINRLNELGADTQPLATPDMWKNLAVCKFEPAEPGYKVFALLLQNVEAERCAIKTYQEICDFTRGKDPVTYAMARQILKDEQEHLTDLTEFVEDIKSTNK